ncbi:MAG: PQQ-binding-like beta-propeller repeat protein [Planctomycetes bacterium]|nr:PQQ-binding-like beta-propeller repeat protein [Planctomycetota bacterium]
MTASPKPESAFLLTATLIAIAVGLSASGPAAPDRPATDRPPRRDWPMFGGAPQRNQANPFAKNLPATWEVDAKKRKNIKWVADLGSKAYGGPVIAGGRIFVGTNNQNPRDKTLKKKERPFDKQARPIDLAILMCFRESDGKFLWQAVHEKLPGGAAVDWPYEGLCSMPAVEGDRLYYVSIRCEVICASVETGKAIWTFDMIKELGVFPHCASACSPLVVDDLVMIVTGNGVNEDHRSIPAPKALSFLAVNKKTGKPVWHDNSPTAKLVGVDRDKPGYLDRVKELKNRGEVLLHAQWSSPAAAVVNGKWQIVFPGGDGWLYAFTQQGKLIWKFDCNPKNAKHQASGRGARSEFVATPVIHDNRVYIGVGQDPEHNTGVGHLWCIDMTKKGDVSSELFDGDKIVKNANSAAVWHYGGAITDKKEQERLQRAYRFGRTISTCAVHDGLIYSADIGGILHCLDANTGKAQWTHDTDASIWASPYYADGKVYLGTDGRSVFVFQHGREKKVVATIEIDGRTRTALIANHGVLYLATENRLYAIANGR